VIVYERDHDFVMVEQHHHALLSGVFAEHWRDEFFVGIQRKSDIVFGVAQHDRAWIGLDTTPLWNDAIKAPYSFIDFPSHLKLPYYQHGIDSVEQENRYAALLCSRHYASFFAESSNPDEQAYFRYELERQKRLRVEFDDVSDYEIGLHVEMLKFLDRLSIYVCINEPGVSKEDEFVGYREGFVNSERFPFTFGKRIVANWLDNRRVGLNVFPFTEEFEASIAIRIVNKEKIHKYGVAEAYQNTPPTVRMIRICPV
jgi:hypothetical protein